MTLPATKVALFEEQQETLSFHPYTKVEIKEQARFSIESFKYRKQNNKID